MHAPFGFALTLMFPCSPAGIRALIGSTTACARRCISHRLIQDLQELRELLTPLRVSGIPVD